MHQTNLFGSIPELHYIHLSTNYELGFLHQATMGYILFKRNGNA